MAAPRTARPHRLLVEDPTGALAGADFSFFRAAGFDVDFCPRPEGQCEGHHDADAVLFDLDAHGEEGRQALRALRRRHPDTPMMVRLPSRSPEGCRTLAVPVSVDGQARAMWAAMSSRRRVG